MSFVFSQRSLDNLKGLDERIVRVAHKALEITTKDFIVIDGLRTKEEQRKYVNSGKSQTMNSRHLTGHAIDVCPYPVVWDWEEFYPIIDAFIQTAKAEDVPIRWGGNWQVNDIREWDGNSRELNAAYTGGFTEAPHLEIPRGY